MVNFVRLYDYIPISFLNQEYFTPPSKAVSSFINLVILNLMSFSAGHERRDKSYAEHEQSDEAS